MLFIKIGGSLLLKSRVMSEINDFYARDTNILQQW